MNRGRFIVFEGIDGSGKSTQVKLLGARLRELNYPVHETAEPTDQPIGSLVRRVLKGELSCVDPALAALFAADRLQHLADPSAGLLKLVSAGVNVICDRYYFSSYAYHSVHAPLEWVIDTNALSAQMLQPDLNIFIDVPVKVCLQRLSASRKNLELYEAEASLAAVRDQYFKAFSRLERWEKIQTIDGRGSPAAVAEVVWQAVRPLFETGPGSTKG